MEHRHGHRRPAAAKVRLTTSSGVTADAVICEISASGALLRSHLPVSLHSVLSVQLLMVGHRQRADSTVSAEVIRHVTGGFAVEWTEFSPQPLRRLLRESRSEVAPTHDRKPAAPELERVDGIAARKR